MTPPPSENEPATLTPETRVPLGVAIFVCFTLLGLVYGGTTAFSNLKHDIADLRNDFERHLIKEHN